MKENNRQALTRTSIALLTILLLMSPAGVAVAGIVTAQQSDSPATASAVTVQTTYDSTVPSQRIHVVLSISATDTALGDVRVKTTGAQNTVIAPKSYQTQGTPGIEVMPQGSGEFHIAEVGPEESVTIFFDVIPTTLETTSLRAATIDVVYVRNGQELTTTLTPTADITQNPWQRQQSLQQQLNDTQTKATVGTVAQGAGIIFGIFGCVAGLFIYHRRREKLEQFKQEFGTDLVRARDMLPPAERAPLERVLNNHGITTDEITEPPDTDPDSKIQDSDSNNWGERLSGDQTQNPDVNRDSDSKPTPNPDDTNWSEKLSDD